MAIDCRAVSLFRHPSDCVIGQKHDHSADDRDKHAVQTETGQARLTKETEQPATDERTDHTENDVEEKALPPAVDDLASDETGDQPENNPTENRHTRTLRLMSTAYQQIQSKIL